MSDNGSFTTSAGVPVHIDDTPGTVVPDLERLVAKWQAILGLRDWRIHASYAKRSSDDVLDSFGRIKVGLPKRTAIMAVLRPEDWVADDAEIDGESVERTVVHELLHIWIEPICSPEQGSPQDIAIEQFINALTAALATGGK